MAQPDVFQKKHDETMAKDQRAILEEMNLPPAVVDFIRKNTKNIKITIAVIVIAILAWEGYGKYTSVQREKSSAILFDAISLEDETAKSDQLKSLAEKYSGTGGGLWAKIELGHLAVKDGYFQEAASLYGNALDGLSKKNPLFPLVQFSLAQAYENLADTHSAKQAYQELLEIGGFATEGHLGLARIAEHEGDLKHALTNYQAYLDLPEVSQGQTKDWVEAKISQLSSAQ